MSPVGFLGLLLLCFAFGSGGSTEVYFVSKNFDNVLHWDPVPPTFPGQKVFYSVQYWRDDEEDDRLKDGCQNITALSCNLTAETPSLHDVHYKAKVFVNDSCIGFTTSFKPLRDTIFGPPILSTKATESTLHVNATLPNGPSGVSIEDIIAKSKEDFSKATVLYTLHITHPEWATQESKSVSGRFEINLKNNKTLYCGYVVYKHIGHLGSENASFCVTLPEEPGELLPWPFLGVALVAGVIIISAVCACNYVKGGKTKTLPKALVGVPGSYKVPRNLTDPVISQWVLNVRSQIPDNSAIQQKPNVLAHGGYSPQDIPCSVFQSTTSSSVGTYSNLVDSTAQSSVTYGAVIHVTPEEDGSFHQEPKIQRETMYVASNFPPDRQRAPELTSSGPSLFPCLEENENMQLVLDTVRDVQGQLVLPSSQFHLYGSSSGDATQSKPLLSDLIFQGEGPFFQSLSGSETVDSGCEGSVGNTPTSLYCNTHYCPSQEDVAYLHPRRQTTPYNVCESSYKKKWIPDDLQWTCDLKVGLMQE